MRKLGAIGAICVLLGALAALSPLTAATGASQAAETLRYSARNKDGQMTEIDADGSGGISAGDYFVGNFVLRSGGKTVGHLEYHCDLATIDPGRQLCSGVVHVSGRGEFSVTDVSNSGAESEKVTITGGIGDFGGASGNGKFLFHRHRTLMTFKVK